jgi:hypothetical protein
MNDVLWWWSWAARIREKAPAKPGNDCAEIDASIHKYSPEFKAAARPEKTVCAVCGQPVRRLEAQEAARVDFTARG